MKQNIFFLLFFVLIAKNSFAQTEPMNTDRPDQTESPELVPEKSLQIETGFAYEKNDGIKTIFHPTTLFRYGAAENFELRLNADIMTLKSQNNISSTGLAPIEIGLKSNLCKEKKILPQISLLTHLVLPKIASENFKSSYLAPVIVFAFQNTVRKNVSLGYNLGAEWDGESPSASFIYTASLAWSLNEHVSSFVEFFGNKPHNSKSVNNLDAGITYLLNTNLQLDISGGVQLSGSTTKNYFSGLGISCRFPA